MMMTARIRGLLLGVALLPLLSATAPAQVIDGPRIMDQRMSENLCAILENGLVVEDGPAWQVLGANRSAAIRAFAGEANL